MFHFFIFGLCLIVVCDFYFLFKYGYPSLSIVITKLYYSKNFKWLTYDIYGNNDFFYKKVSKSLSQISK